MSGPQQQPVGQPQFDPAPHGAFGADPTQTSQIGSGPVTGVPAPGAAGAAAPGPYGPYAPHYAPPKPLTAGPIGIGLLGGAVFAGLITYLMGFVSWVTIRAGADIEAERWADNIANGDAGIPGFFSYEIILNPGKFLIFMGAVALAAALTFVPRYQGAQPYLAVAAGAGWLALLSAAVATPPMVGIGAGAIVALIFGFMQFLLLAVLAVLRGLGK